MKQIETFTTQHRRQKQIEETKNNIKIAMLALMENQDIKKIKIADLMQKAGYTRRTFYRHFYSSEDVLKSIITDIVFELFAYLDNKDTEQNFAQTVTLFFNFWTQYTAILKKLKQQNLSYLLQSIAFENIQQSKLAVALKQQQNQVYIEYFALSGMFSLLTIWVDDNCQKSVEEMGQIAQEIKDAIK